MCVQVNDVSNLHEIINSVEFWKIAIPSLAAIVIAFLSHQLAVSRQFSEQRKKQRIEYLTSSFKSLMMYSNNPDELEGLKHLRDATIGIQFLGSKYQVQQMQTILDKFKAGESAELDPLICSLRDELRQELDLEKVDGNVYWAHPKKR